MRFRDFVTENHEDDELEWADHALMAIGKAHEEHIRKKYGEEHAKNANYGWGVSGDDHSISVATKIYDPNGDGQHHTITTELFHPDLDPEDMHHSWNITNASKKDGDPTKIDMSAIVKRFKLKESKRNYWQEAEFLYSNLNEFGHHPDHADACFQLARDHINDHIKEADPEHQRMHAMIDHAEMNYFNARRANDTEKMNQHISIPLAYIGKRERGNASSPLPSSETEH